MKKKTSAIHEEKIKQELLEKIAEYHDVLRERADIENDNPEITDTDLCEIDDEYACLSRKTILLEEEIEKLMLETKYFPLMNLNEEQMRDLVLFERASNLSFEVNIEEHLYGLLQELSLKMQSRIRKIKPLRIYSFLDSKARGIYREIIKCYIYGNFIASCALCRPLVEYLVKKLIDYKGLGDFVVGKEKGSKKFSIQNILSEYKLVSPSVVSDYTDIYDKVSVVLHSNGLLPNEEETFELIRKLQKFIKEITPNVLK